MTTTKRINLTEENEVWYGWENDTNYEVFAGGGDDTLYGFDGDDTLDGGMGNDEIYGANVSDSLRGGQGHDKLDGGEGDDTLDGGEGDDTLFGYTGNDTLLGGDGNDLIFGYDGNDWIDAGAGTDTVSGENHQDTIYGGDGDDYLDGGNGKDTIYGEIGNDYLNGYNGQDYLDGGADNDRLDGGSADDTLIGGTGEDTLDGGDGNDQLDGVGISGINSIDILIGGNNADTFILGNHTQVYYDDENLNANGVNDYAIIKDFHRLEDKIRLHGSASDYVVADIPTELETSFASVTSAIYLDTDGSGDWGNTDELIAVVENISANSLVLDGDYFEYTDNPNAFPWHPDNDSGWELVFSDEFNATALDLNKWNTRYTTFPQYDGRTNPWNNESQYYVGDNEVIDAVVHDAFEFDNGILRIVAKELQQPITAEIGSPTAGLEDVKTFDYTSGMLSSHNNYAFTYGYMEIRAKVPIGQGIWPAFWMLPSSGEWPPEIDVMEMRGDRPDTVFNTVHYEDNSGNHQYFQGEQTFYGIDFSQDFHTFAVNWNSDKLTWYIDNHAVFTTDNNIPDVPMFLLANLAIGGYFPGSADETTPNTNNFEIDYIRVYQDASGILHGGLADDTLTKEIGSLFGEAGNDILTGGTGNNTLNGGEGNDTLIGVDNTDMQPGVGETDTFTGGQGQDTFVLGDGTNVYYNDGDNFLPGLEDYALITDFNSTEDIIQLTGQVNDYVLGAVSFVTGTGIYQDTDADATFSSMDELIAVVQGNPGFSLTDSSFLYV